MPVLSLAIDGIYAYLHLIPRKNRGALRASSLMWWVLLQLNQPVACIWKLKPELKPHLAGIE